MHSVSIIIFGATGDLAKQKLFPALWSLWSSRQIEVPLQIIAIGRRDYTDETFRENIQEGFEVESGQEVAQQDFARLIRYYRMDLEEKSEYLHFKKFLEEKERELGGQASRLFYLSIPPSSYNEVFSGLAESGIYQECQTGWSRIVVEKPFGHSQVTARNLNHRVQELFTEEEIYRVDHYLGKETTQNILAFRFANGMFEPLWNHNFIDHIQITVAESEGIGSRGRYYDHTGALRDIIQNHGLQLLSLLTMEEPAEFSFTALSNEKMKVLEYLKPDLSRSVFGQYDGYRKEEYIDEHSKTETYAMATFFIDSSRWTNVPIYIRTGKRMAKRISEISVQFKETHQHLFNHMNPQKAANVLTFRIQPDEGISLQLAVKTPRHQMQVQPVQMEFCYGLSFRMKLPDAYERLFLDIISGDKTLAIRDDIIEESWRIIDPLVEAVPEAKIHKYEPGSWGPDEADRLMSVDGRKWLAHESTVCNGVIISES